MLQPHHVGNIRITRTIRASIGRHVHQKLQPRFGWTCLPYPPWHASSARRSLCLSPTAPIQIPPDRQTINISLRDGKVITQKFSPTPKANLDRLGKALSELLQTPEHHTVVEAVNQEAKDKDTSTMSFGTVEWHLDSEGDAIHRHTALPSTTELNVIQDLIMRRADEMGHHPHISRGTIEEEADTYMTITCTTHSPRGLSVRDMRLAQKINEVLTGFDTLTPSNLDSSRDMEDEKLRIAALRERMVAANRAKINEALDSCGCEAAKSRSTTPP